MTEQITIRAPLKTQNTQYSDAGPAQIHKPKTFCLKKKFELQK